MKGALSPAARLNMAVLKARLAARPRGAPHSLFLGLTARCNLRCRHCRYAAGPRGPALPAALLRRLLREAASAGVPRAVFFGGEPLLYPGLEEAAALASRLGLFTELDTNGRLLTPARARRLAAAGLACAMISLHSDRETEHDAVSGKGSFRSAVAAIAAAREAGLIAYVSSCVFAGGTRPAALRRLLAFAARSGAQGARLLPYAAPSGRGTPPPRLASGLAAADPRGFAASCAGRSGCAAGTDVLYCGPDGEMRACPYAASALGPARGRPLVSFFGRGTGLFPCRAVC